MEIKTRNGFPTKKAMIELLESFNEKLWHVKLSYGWSFPNDKLKLLIWNKLSTQEEMEKFILHALTLGFVLGRYSPYNGKDGINGSLQIVAFNKV